MKKTTIEQREIIYVFNVSSSSLSIFGCLFIIIMFIKYKSLRSDPFKIITILSVIDTFGSMAFLIPTFNKDSKDFLCQFQAMSLNFFATLSILWTTYIALYLYQVIVRSNLHFQRYMYYALVIFLIISIISTIAPLLTNSYGTISGWCWISQHNMSVNSGFYERYFLFFIPAVALIITNVTLYASVSRRLRSTEQINKSSVSLNRKLKYYPIVLIICYIPYLIKSVLELTQWAFINEYDFEYTAVVGVIRAGNGLLNAIVYGFTKNVKRILCYTTEGLEDDFVSDDENKRKSTIESQYTTKTSKDIITKDSLTSIN